MLSVRCSARSTRRWLCVAALTTGSVFASNLEAQQCARSLTYTPSFSDDVASNTVVSSTLISVDAPYTAPNGFAATFLGGVGYFGDPVINLPFGGAPGVCSAVVTNSFLVGLIGAGTSDNGAISLDPNPEDPSVVMYLSTSASAAMVGKSFDEVFGFSKGIMVQQLVNLGSFLFPGVGFTPEQELASEFVRSFSRAVRDGSTSFLCNWSSVTQYTGECSSETSFSGYAQNAWFDVANQNGEVGTFDVIKFSTASIIGTGVVTQSGVPQSPTPVPEPSSLTMALAGLLAIASARRWKQQSRD